jgi:hypothetical protein
MFKKIIFTRTSLGKSILNALNDHCDMSVCQPLDSVDHKSAFHKDAKFPIQHDDQLFLRTKIFNQTCQQLFFSISKKEIFYNKFPITI